MQKAKAKAEQVSGRAKETLGRAREKVADQRAKRAGSDERSMRERLKDAKDAFKR
ncbi:CsbD family protein [Streptomyces sp. XC 2026]|nr:CsbD family protein [Streptomyces sp. XC 2026]